MISLVLRALVAALLDIGSGTGIGRHAGDNDPIQHCVGLPVAAPVESMSDGLTRRSLDGCHAAHVRPGGFGAEPLWVIAGGCQQDGGSLGGQSVDG